MPYFASLDGAAMPSTRGLYQVGHDLTKSLGSLSAGGFHGHIMNLFKHATNADEVVIEDLFGCIQQLEHRSITHRIIDVSTLFAGYDNIFVPQDSELLRSVGLLNVETLTDLVDGQFTVAQSVENRYS